MTDLTETTKLGFTTAHEGGIVRITLTKPERLNAIDYDTLLALGKAVEDASADSSVRVIVIAGEGRAFSAGYDLAASKDQDARGITSEMVMDAATATIKAIVNAPIPVVTRVTGAAAGIGASLAVAADISYASPDAYLLLAFINVGLMPDGGASALIAASAGRAKAAEMALLGGRVPAEEAVAYGLITSVVPRDELDAKVEAAVAKLASGPRRAQQLTKQAINAATLKALDEALDLEKAGQVELMQSPDYAEGVAAMLGKRKAIFAG